MSIEYTRFSIIISIITLAVLIFVLIKRKNEKAIVFTPTTRWFFGAGLLVLWACGLSLARQKQPRTVMGHKFMTPLQEAVVSKLKLDEPPIWVETRDEKGR